MSALPRYKKKTKHNSSLIVEDVNGRQGLAAEYEAVVLVLRERHFLPSVLQHLLQNILCIHHQDSRT